MSAPEPPEGAAGPPGTHGPATRSRPVIALLTDFGLADSYVGTMKGVIAGICPQAAVIDITHGVPPQDVRAGAFHLLSAYRYFPLGTIFVVVVDPGVGTERPLVAVRASGYIFLGPDNGVLRWAVDDAGGPATTVRIESEAHRLPSVSRTFHGRDVLAPAAAHLATRVPVESLGPTHTRLAGNPFPVPVKRGDITLGTIVHVDHFGNCISNLRGPLAPSAHVEVAGVHVRLADTYGEGAPGEALAIVSSAGFLEIAVNGGNAATLLGISAGDEVTVRETAA